MNQYLIIWQDGAGLIRDLLVYAASKEAARERIEAIFDEGDKILSCEETGNFLAPENSEQG
jgi:hypothetical protein